MKLTIVAASSAVPAGSLQNPTYTGPSRSILRSRQKRPNAAARRRDRNATARKRAGLRFGLANVPTRVDFAGETDRPFLVPD